MQSNGLTECFAGGLGPDFTYSWGPGRVLEATGPDTWNSAVGYTILDMC